MGRSSLARFVGEHAHAAGFPRLANAGKRTVWRTLDDNDIKPHKIHCYLAHILKETVAYLSSRPGRFEYVHAPKQGSWPKVTMLLILILLTVVFSEWVTAKVREKLV